MAKRSSASLADDVQECRRVMQRVSDNCPRLCLQEGCTCPLNELHGSPCGSDSTASGPDREHANQSESGDSTSWVIPSEDDWERSPFTFDRPSNCEQPVVPCDRPVERVPGTPPGPPPPTPLRDHVPQTPPELLSGVGRPAPQTPPELLRAAAFRHSGPSPVGLLRGEPYLQVPQTPAELLSGVGRPAPQTPPELLRAVSAPFRRSGPSPVQLLRGEPYPGLTREMTSLMVDFCLLFLPYMLDMLLLGRNFPNGHSENGRF